ncbi:hypothetical protein BJ508DRAFT_312659 [Ascobolus immersus RN42]|uniref:IBR domain-containing protein n=1 Tax=Ascobolus immersus RN42 TaxID=1160509 RepID=A0A3N4HQA9_ASCIM|nr:hypothetical protein BJ508DRAFT_312659 [Ascobolus immersus RN42]
MPRTTSTVSFTSEIGFKLPSFFAKSDSDEVPPQPVRANKCPGKIAPIVQADMRYYFDKEYKCTGCRMWFTVDGNVEHAGSVCSVRACRHHFCKRCGETEKGLDDHSLLTAAEYKEIVGRTSVRGGTAASEFVEVDLHA